MIADHEANVVYVADSLERRFPTVHNGLRTILERHGIPLRTIPGTKDIWCRDYMPIQVTGDRFVQFRYEPDYLSGKYRPLRADGEIGTTLPWVEDCVRSEIVLDGGNVVGWSDKVILTEKVFAENPRWRRRELVTELARILEVEQVVLIPPEPGDAIGHSDGLVRFVDSRAVVVNDHRKADRGYRRVLLRRLKAAGLVFHEVPYRPLAGLSEGIPSAEGNYVNYLRVGKLLVLPLYGLSEDAKARASLVGAHPGFVLETLSCRELAAKGGVLNCSTWTLREKTVPETGVSTGSRTPGQIG